MVRTRRRKSYRKTKRCNPSPEDEGALWIINKYSKHADDVREHADDVRELKEAIDDNILSPAVAKKARAWLKGGKSARKSTKRKTTKRKAKKSYRESLTRTERATARRMWLRKQSLAEKRARKAAKSYQARYAKGERFNPRRNPKWETTKNRDGHEYSRADVIKAIKKIAKHKGVPAQDVIRDFGYRNYGDYVDLSKTHRLSRAKSRRSRRNPRRSSRSYR